MSKNVPQYIEGKALDKIERGNTYSRCTFYLDKPVSLRDNVFENCSFRDVTRVSFIENCKIDRCGFSYLIVNMSGTTKRVDGEFVTGMRKIPVGIKPLLPHLDELYLEKNSIESFPIWMKKAKRLKILDMSHNNIHKDIEVPFLENLEVIKLNNNPTQEISFMGDYKRLEHIDISNTSLARLHFYLMENLKCIYRFSNNRYRYHGHILVDHRYNREGVTLRPEATYPVLGFC